MSGTVAEYQSDVGSTKVTPDLALPGELTLSYGVCFVNICEERWWRHQMETFSALLAICAGNSPASVEFPAQRPVTWIFDVFFDLRPNKWLSKQSWGWWFKMPSHPLWRHCNVHHVITAPHCMCLWIGLSFLYKTCWAPQPLLTYFQLEPYGKISIRIQNNCSGKFNWNSYFASDLNVLT